MNHMVNDLMDVHLTSRRSPEKSMFDGGIGEFGNQKDETNDNSD